MYFVCPQIYSSLVVCSTLCHQGPDPLGHAPSLISRLPMWFGQWDALVGRGEGASPLSSEWPSVSGLQNSASFPLSLLSVANLWFAFTITWVSEPPSSV